MIPSQIEDDYALLADKKGDMLIMRVAHKLTGMVIYTKRKRVLNDLHIKSELYKFRDYMLNQNGLKQAVLDHLTKSHGINPEGKDLRTILNEIKEAQDNKGYFDISREELDEIKTQVENGQNLDELLEKKKLKKKSISSNNLVIYP